jgi:hypothetical protein
MPAVATAMASLDAQTDRKWASRESDLSDFLNKFG